MGQEWEQDGRKDGVRGFNVIFYDKVGNVDVCVISNIYESLTGADVSRGCRGAASPPPPAKSVVNTY